MGWRFRKSIRIAPGIRINLSRSGVSTSLGGRGATINASRRGVRGTVGIPGSGISYSERLGAGRRRRGAGSTTGTTGCARTLVWIAIAIVVAIIVF